MTEITDNTPVAITERRYAIAFRKGRIAHLNAEIERMKDQKAILEHELGELMRE